MLDEEVYWAIIDSSLHETTNQEDQELYLVSAIEVDSSRNDRLSFKNRQTSFDSYNPELWCAAYIVSGGCSDGFEYFRCWLISQGKVFYHVKSNLF
jgi:hypothetical protein